MSTQPPDVPNQPEGGPEIPTALPAAPQTNRVAVKPPTPEPLWPLVLGIIAVVWGGLTLVCGIGGMASAKVFSSSAPLQAQTRPLMIWTPWQTVFMVIGFGISAFLVVTGIGLIRRCRWSVTAVRCWAVLQMASAVIGVIIGLLTLEKTIAAIPSSRAPGPPAAMFKIWIVVGMVISLAFNLAPAVFMLIWFSRKKIKAQAVGWR